MRCEITPPPPSRPHNGRTWPRRLGLVSSLGCLILGIIGWCQRREPQEPTEIFQGITYGCERLEPTTEGHGLVHWLRIALATPGIELYVTPLDPTAIAQGWQYRLKYPNDVLHDERLAVVVNACLFTSESDWIRRSGDLARSVETVVANHKVSHFWEHTYLLWFDDHLVPHLKPSKPPGEDELMQALWGIGGQGVGLQDGKIWPGLGAVPNSRSAVAIDAERQLLYLAVGEYISPRLILTKLADLGAKTGMLLDGGGSSAMVISSAAQGVRPGIMHDRGRPVATSFGVRARAMPAPE